MNIICLKCLDDTFIPFQKLNLDWKGDKRYPEQAIQKFITYNKEVLNFLGVSVKIDEENYVIGLRLTTSSFVGVAPLRAPANGKYYADIEISSRFGENVSEVAFMLKDTLEPEYLDQDIQHQSQLRAPFYFDCINYFNSFLSAIREPWNKFDVTVKVEQQPTGTTNWTKYALNSCNPNKKLFFENRKNIQSRDHREWQELVYMLGVAINEFDSHKTPASIKLKFSDILTQLRIYYQTHRSVRRTNLFQTYTFESPRIKAVKVCANKLLQHNTANTKAWRIDSAELFERYVQYVLRLAGNIVGASVISNKRFSIRAALHPKWMLNHLEPDIILQKGDSLYFADAKYKSHMFNTRTSTEDLKATFRHDLHQVLAYSSFNPGKDKTSLLIYPFHNESTKSQEAKIIKLDATNPLANVHNRIYLIGIPIVTTDLNPIVRQIAALLTEQNKEQNNVI